MKKLKPFIKPFKTSIAYFNYALMLGIAFICIIFNSYNGDVYTRIGYSILLTLDVLCCIYYALTSNLKTMKWYNYLIIGLAGLIISYGLLSLTSSLTYIVCLIIFGFTFAAFSLSWLIYKLVILILDDNEHFCPVTFVYICLVACLALSVGIQQIIGICRVNNGEKLALIIKKDVISNLNDIDKELKNITYLTYENNNLTLGITTFDEEYLMFDYNYASFNNLEDVLNDILNKESLSDFTMRTTYATSFIGLGENVNLASDYNFPFYKTMNNYTDISDNIMASGFIRYTSNDNEIKYCSYLKDVSKDDINLFNFETLGNELVSYFIYNN